VANPANYENLMVTSFFVRFLLQRLKTQKDSLRTDWRPSGKGASWKGGHSCLRVKHCSLFDGQCRVWNLARCSSGQCSQTCQFFI